MGGEERRVVDWAIMIERKYCLLPIPNLHQIITSSGNKTSSRAWFRLAAHQAAGASGWRPADGVDAQPMRGEDLMLPAPLVKLEHADAAVG